MTGTKSKQVLIAGIFGNALEWYDFSVYAFLVPVLAKLFFPATNEFVSLLQTFGVFALGFLVRPFGAILFGYLGDHIGRKKALILSIILMSFPTFLLGLLPDYSHIGIFAPLLLILLRLIQGLAVSGELTTATVFLVEHAASNRRGIAGSLAMCSAFIGIALSSAIASLVSEILNDTQLYAWGWRIPFLIGGLIGVVGFIIRVRTIETSAYEKIDKKDALPSVLQHMLSLNYRTVVVAVMLTAIMAIGNYFLIAFFNTFLIETQGFPLRQTMIINFFSLACMTLLMPFMGKLSDVVGRKMILKLGILGIIIFTYPSFWLLTQQNIFSAFAGELLFAIVLSAIAGVIPVTLSELFDTYHRNSGISLSYNLSLAIFGGTAPLIGITSIALFNSPFAPVWYIIASALLGLLALTFIKESYRKAL